MVDGMLSLSWNNHSSTFCHMLSTVRDTERYTDVTLACDGKFYPAHKLVLSTCSDYFLKMFEKTPCKHPVIVIKDVECKNIEALLHYMYAGIVNVSQSDLAQLIRAAELLEIKGLAVPDEPPSGSKRPVNTQEASGESNSPQPKRLREDDKRTSSQREAPGFNSSVPSSLSVSLRRDEHVEEQASDYENYGKNNQRLTLISDHNQERRDHRSCNKNSEYPDTEQAVDTLPLTERSQNKVAGEGDIKEEKVELESEGEGAETGFEYESLMTDLTGEETENAKDHSSLLPPTFNHTLNNESYEAQAGPSGLQGWPSLGESGEALTQGYSGDLAQDLPLVGHPGPQPHQIQHMVRKYTDEDTLGGQVLGALSNFTAANKRYQCSSCEYTTDNSTCFTRHMRTHTGEKPFHCPYCPTRCTRKASLLSHIQGHTGEAPLMCRYCPYVSRQRSNMKRHMKRLHTHLIPDESVYQNT